MSHDLRIHDPEALPRCAYAIDRHLEGLQMAVEEAGARSRTVVQQIRDAVAAHYRRVKDLETRLAAAEPEPRRGLSRALADARADLEAARRAEREAIRAQDQSRGALERMLSTSRQIGARGRAELQLTFEGLHEARGRFSAALAALHGSSAVAAQLGAAALIAGRQESGVRADASRPSPAPGAGDPIGADGHVMVALSDIDDADSKVRGPEAFDPDVLSYRHALTAAHRLELVIEAVRGGSDLEGMRRLDEARGSAGSIASYTRTFEGFFGSRAIALSRRGDGRYEVLNGYHRIYAARQAGLSVIPARVISQ